MKEIPSDFWGFATVLIDSEVINDTFKKWSDDRFNIAIRGRHGLGSLGEVFLGNEEFFEKSIVKSELKFDGGSWVLAASTNILSLRFHELGVFLVIIFIAFGVSLLMKQLDFERKKLRDQARTDYLTKIYNRRSIISEAEKCFKLYKRYGVKFSVISFDIDKFKSVNDNFGHGAGDDILKGVAELFSNNVRKIDIFGRYGGEEFIIICPHTACEDAVVLAEKLRNLLSETNFEVVGKVTASFGVAGCSDQDNVQSLFERADEGMYRAKNSGRNAVFFVRVSDLLCMSNSVHASQTEGA